MNSTIYDLLEEKGFNYDYIYDGWVGKTPGQFFSTEAINQVPGDVRHYLLTGEVRSSRIFDPSSRPPSLTQLGFKIDTDGKVTK